METKSRSIAPWVAETVILVAAPLSALGASLLYSASVIQRSQVSYCGAAVSLLLVTGFVALILSRRCRDRYEGGLWLSRPYKLTILPATAAMMVGIHALVPMLHRTQGVLAEEIESTYGRELAAIVARDADARKSMDEAWASLAVSQAQYRAHAESLVQAIKELDARCQEFAGLNDRFGRWRDKLDSGARAGLSADETRIREWLGKANDYRGQAAGYNAALEIDLEEFKKQEELLSVEKARLLGDLAKQPSEARVSFLSRLGALSVAVSTALGSIKAQGEYVSKCSSEIGAYCEAVKGWLSTREAFPESPAPLPPPTTTPPGVPPPQRQPLPPAEKLKQDSERRNWWERIWGSVKQAGEAKQSAGGDESGVADPTPASLPGVSGQSGVAKQMEDLVKAMAAAANLEELKRLMDTARANNKGVDAAFVQAGAIQPLTEFWQNNEKIRLAGPESFKEHYMSTILGADHRFKTAQEKQLTLLAFHSKCKTEADFQAVKAIGQIPIRD